MSEITLEDIGPITDLRIPVSESGGVYVLLGQNGTGKTTAINAVRATASGQGRIEQRDGAARGEVNAFGATLRVARRLSRSGELEVASIEGRFSIEDLVDPKIGDLLSADAKRIKALIQLSDNSTADAAMFYDLVGGQEQFDSLVDADSIKTDDLVMMAARIKRDLEAHSRRLAADAERDFTKAEAARLSATDVNVNAPHDQTELSKELSLADREDARLNAEVKAANDAKEKREKAQIALNKSKSAYQGVSVDTASDFLAEKQLCELGAGKLVAQLEKQLAEAKNDLRECVFEREMAEAKLKEAQTYESTISDIEAILSQPLGLEPDAADLEIAAIRLQEARRRVEEGVRVRLAISALENASKIKASALQERKESERLRDAAKATDDVLSKAVQALGCPLRVSLGRLVTDTDRGVEHFSDLSEGEKYSIAIPIAVEAVGKGGLITLSQEAWQGLDPHNKQLVASKVEGTGVILLTAQATDDAELKAEYFDPFPIS